VFRIDRSTVFCVIYGVCQTHTAGRNSSSSPTLREAGPKKVASTGGRKTIGSIYNPAKDRKVTRSIEDHKEFIHSFSLEKAGALQLMWSRIDIDSIPAFYNARHHDGSL
jgi:hypothetical protein